MHCLCGSGLSVDNCHGSVREYVPRLARVTIRLPSTISAETTQNMVRYVQSRFNTSAKHGQDCLSVELLKRGQAVHWRCLAQPGIPYPIDDWYKLIDWLPSSAEVVPEMASTQPLLELGRPQMSSLRGYHAMRDALLRAVTRSKGSNSGAPGVTFACRRFMEWYPKGYVDLVALDASLQHHLGITRVLNGLVYLGEETIKRSLDAHTGSPLTRVHARVELTPLEIPASLVLPNLTAVRTAHIFHSFFFWFGVEQNPSWAVDSLVNQHSPGWTPPGTARPVFPLDAQEVRKLFAWSVWRLNYLYQLITDLSLFSGPEGRCNPPRLMTLQLSVYSLLEKIVLLFAGQEPQSDELLVLALSSLGDTLGRGGVTAVLQKHWLQRRLASLQHIPDTALARRLLDSATVAYESYVTGVFEGVLAPCRTVLAGEPAVRLQGEVVPAWSYAAKLTTAFRNVTTHNWKHKGIPPQLLVHAGVVDLSPLYRVVAALFLCLLADPEGVLSIPRRGVSRDSTD